MGAVREWSKHPYGTRERGIRRNRLDVGREGGWRERRTSLWMKCRKIRKPKEGHVVLGQPVRLLLKSSRACRVQHKTWADSQNARIPAWSFVTGIPGRFAITPPPSPPCRRVIGKVWSPRARHLFFLYLLIIYKQLDDYNMDTQGYVCTTTRTGVPQN